MQLASAPPLRALQIQLPQQMARAKVVLLLMRLANGFEVIKDAVLDPSANGVIAGRVSLTRAPDALCAAPRNTAKLIAKSVEVVVAKRTNPRVRGEEVPIPILLLLQLRQRRQQLQQQHHRLWHLHPSP